MVEIDRDKVRKLFEDYDLNKNCILEKNEFMPVFRKMLHELGEYIPDKRHDQVMEEGMEQFDLNKNGIIEFDEFYNLINFLVNEKGYVLK